MTRRDAMLSGALTPAGIAGVLGLGQAQAQVSTTALRHKRSLTVKELTQEELIEMERLEIAATQAQQAVGDYQYQLRTKYGAQGGVDVHFESGYAFIRDYRDEMLAQHALTLEQE